MPKPSGQGELAKLALILLTLVVPYLQRQGERAPRSLSDAKPSREFS